MFSIFLLFSDAGRTGLTGFAICWLHCLSEVQNKQRTDPVRFERALQAANGVFKPRLRFAAL
ncbi:hypothetical protein BG454_09915 [Roseinatronobacter bogoriensis subsp. barguzinensis]|uniref:Uncharacterized protein n=2 Tax=Roseinatronobacter bogoriensis TaxID=119542 RepID=A0A2K8KAU0_9RHOB|nr:hypothetical protein BG454_09915 [Rhodobaca barguzinensis]